MYLLEPKGGRGGRSLGLFYCLLLCAGAPANVDLARILANTAFAYFLKGKTDFLSGVSPLTFDLAHSGWYDLVFTVPVHQKIGAELFFASYFMYVMIHRLYRILLYTGNYRRSILNVPQNSNALYTANEGPVRPRSFIAGNT
jgi:hypothetical protein